MKRLEHGAKFILATFPLAYKGKPFVLELASSLAEAFSRIEDYPDEMATVCSVEYWTTPGTYGGMDCTPCGVRELYQIKSVED